MDIRPIKISDFRAIHRLSIRTFSRMREKVQRKFPDVQVTELHYRRIHNNNVVLRPDLFKEFLPFGDLTEDAIAAPIAAADAIGSGDLYARIARLEAEVLSQREALKKPVANLQRELACALEA